MCASSCRAVVLIGVAAAFCTAFLPHIAKPSVASKREEANRPGACPPQWLPVLLASDPVPHTHRRRLVSGHNVPSPSPPSSPPLPSSPLPSPPPPPPLQPGSVNEIVSAKEITLVLKAGGTVQEYEAKADSVKVSLRKVLLCFLPACVLTVIVADTSSTCDSLSACEGEDPETLCVSAACYKAVGDIPGHHQLHGKFATMNSRQRCRTFAYKEVIASVVTACSSEEGEVGFTVDGVFLKVVATDTSGGASQVRSAAVALQTKALDAMSSVLGVTIEERPAIHSVIDVQVQVTRFAPSPPPPSSLPELPSLPFPPPPSLPPPSPPTAPPSSPTASSEDKTNSQGVPWVLLVSLSVLLVVAVVLLVLGYSRHSRVTRDRANLRISRDRANLDLQMISHQVHKKETQADDSASLPDSLHAKRPSSLANARTASLPPGPPSSSTGHSVGESNTDGADLVQNTKTRSSLSSLPLGAPFGTAGGSSTAPPLTWAEADRQWLQSQGATDVEGLVLAGSLQNPTGFEGVYASGGGFEAKLQKGAKRLRQNGFRSPVEAALARARWTKSLEEGGKGNAPSATAGTSSGRSTCNTESSGRSTCKTESPGQQEQLAAEALADLAMAGGPVGAQPIVSAKRAAHTKHTNTRWLARWLPLSGRW